MADCEKLKQCPFFRAELAYMPKTAARLKETYCRGDSRGCARYLVVSNGILPPADLFPNDREQALKILSNQNR